jgi:hypothetical protein
MGEASAIIRVNCEMPRPSATSPNVAMVRVRREAAALRRQILAEASRTQPQVLRHVL